MGNIPAQENMTAADKAHREIMMRLEV